jgi:hypothetical protein
MLKAVLEMLKNQKFVCLAVTVVCGLMAAVCGPVFASANPGWVMFDKVRELNTEGMLSQSRDCGTLSGVLYNPAFLGINKLHILELASEAGFADDRLARVMYGQPALGGELMAGAAYYDAGSVELNWVDNNTMQTQTVSLERDSLAMLAYGRKVCPNVYAGVNIKAASSQLAEAQAANAYAADIGAMVEVGPRLMLSAALLNSGSATKFIDESDPLPQTGSVGLLYNSCLGENMSIALGIGALYCLVNEKYTYTTGASLRYGAVSVNAGYSLQDSMHALTYGGGVNFGNYMLGLSFTQTSYIDSIQRLTLGVRFGASKQTAK